MIGNLNVILKIFQENKIIACYWALHVFELHEINGEVNIGKDSLIAEVEISEDKLQQLLRSFEIRKVKCEIISRS